MIGLLQAGASQSAAFLLCSKTGGAGVLWERLVHDGRYNGKLQGQWIGKEKERKGFMLLELIIVVAIVGILSAVAMPDILGMTNDAKAARIQADLSAIGTASEMYYVKNGEYPTALSQLVDTTGANGYLKKMPEPPDKSVTYTMGSKGEVTAVFNSVTYSSYGTTSTSTQQS